MNLRIKTIARLTGVREATLRAWERRYGFPQPERTASGYRSYSRNEMEAVRRVARLISQGYAASEAIAQVRQAAEAPEGADDTPERIEDRFWSAAMMLDALAASAVLEEAAQTRSPLALCDELLLPILRRMTLKVDVAREHLASAVVRQKLRTLIDTADVPADGPTIVLACPSREQHEGGLLGVGLHLRHAGWKVLVLGADTPVEAMSAACAASDADALAVSFVRSVDAEELASMLREIVQAVKVPVVVGGPATIEHLRLISTTGARWAGSPEDVARFVAQARR